MGKKGKIGDNKNIILWTLQIFFVGNNVYSILNIDNFYLKKPIKNEEEKLQLINQEIDNYIQNEIHMKMII